MLRQLTQKEGGLWHSRSLGAQDDPPSFNLGPEARTTVSVLLNSPQKEEITHTESLIVITPPKEASSHHLGKVGEGFTPPPPGRHGGFHPVVSQGEFRFCVTRSLVPDIWDRGCKGVYVQETSSCF